MRGSRQCRPWFDCERDLAALRPSQPQLDPSRGELRLSAEVMLAEINGTTVPAIPRQRAIHTLNVLANQ